MQVRNIKPRGRSRAKGREGIEKQRLAERRTNHTRHDPKVIMKPFSIGGSTPLYMPENQRFITMGAAHEEKSRRDVLVTKKRDILSSKRSENISRERSRWQHEERKYVASDARMKMFRETGKKAMRNKSSVPFDPVNHRFKDGLDAQRMVHMENNFKYRAEVRKDRLYSKANGRFNPITGVEKIKNPVRQRPVTPPNLKHIPKWKRNC